MNCLFIYLGLRDESSRECRQGRPCRRNHKTSTQRKIPDFIFNVFGKTNKFLNNLFFDLLISSLEKETCKIFKNNS